MGTMKTLHAVCSWTVVVLIVAVLLVRLLGIS